jgi:alkylresorcinol/alkylpyrone synthase
MSRPAAPVALLSLATASPPHILAQADVAAAAQRLFEDRFPQFARMAGVFKTAGVHTRQTVQPMEWYLEPRGWPERSATYLEGGVELFVQAAGRALSAAGLRGADVDIVVTVSSTGIATPSLDARAMARLGLRQDIRRVPVFGLGCAGGASGLGLASALARASPRAVVLLVAVELCSLAFRLDDLGKADIVATALFGDGAAACVLQTDGEGLAEIAGSAERTWPDTLDIMGWRVEPTGLGVILERSIPTFARQHLGAAMACMLAPSGLEVREVDRFLCHPGGMKVIEALEGALHMPQGRLDHERDVLAAHGNMSAPTVLFVLDRALRAGLPDLSVLTALGPGFTASSVTLRRTT